MKIKYNRERIVQVLGAVIAIVFAMIATWVVTTDNELEIFDVPEPASIKVGPYIIAERYPNRDVKIEYVGRAISVVITEDVESLTILNNDLDVLYRYSVDEIHTTVDELAFIVRASNTDVSFDDCRSIANEIIYQCEVFGFRHEDLPYILALYYAESRFDPAAKNSASTASGIGQLLRMHWIEGVDPFDIEWNIARSMELMAANYREELSLDSRWRHVNLRYTGGSSTAGMLYVEQFQDAMESQ